MVLKVLRGEKDAQVIVNPRFQEVSRSWLLGVHMTLKVDHIEHRSITLGRAAMESVRYPVEKSRQILRSLWDIVTGKEKPDFQGPVAITGVISDSIESGWVSALELMAALNVYLCIFNLLPFPALDGGRLAFLTYELATRRRPNAKIETAVHLAGGLVLVVLMLVVTYKEVATGIRKLFS